MTSTDDRPKRPTCAITGSPGSARRARVRTAKPRAALNRVSTPKTVLKDASLMVNIAISHTGYAGRTVTVDVEDEGRIVGTQQITFPNDGSPATARVRATAIAPGGASALRR